MSDLITKDTKIRESGAVTGTLKYVQQWDEFSNNPDEKSGYYFPVHLGNEYKGKTIKVTGEKEKEAADTEWVLLVKDNQSTFTFECDKKTILTLSFPNTKFEPKPVAKSKAVRKTATKKSVNTDNV